VVLEDVLEMDDLGGLGADGEQSDLVQHLRGAVHTASNPRQSSLSKYARTPAKAGHR